MLRDDGGLATLETTLMITILVPLLFAVIEFGDVFQRWLAQESATVQVARYAAEVGGDGPEVRALLNDSLRQSGIDPSLATLEVTPPRVGWREQLTVTVRTSAAIAIPFLFSATIPVRTTAIVRGEVAR
ncbi:MAG: pilus assembly protein [Actinobacteria bacterium]|nr:pilus assembly protein [Actinomycetota bacterium]